MVGEEKHAFFCSLYVAKSTEMQVNGEIVAAPLVSVLVFPVLI